MVCRDFGLVVVVMRTVFCGVVSGYFFSYKSHDMIISLPLLRKTRAVDSSFPEQGWETYVITIGM